MRTVFSTAEEMMPTWRSRFHLVMSLFAFTVTPTCTVGGVWLIVVALAEHGNTASKIFAGSAGLLLLLISPILFTFGIITWTSEFDRTE